MSDKDQIVGNKANVEDDWEEAVTMLDVLQDEADLEDDVKAVLGAADDKNCTYPSGYVKRQALYACMTCSPAVSGDDGGSADSAGVCLACSYACHNDHQLVELYTKRNFRCDCGNSRLKSNPCQLVRDPKGPDNPDNRYNQNFRGLYCTCHRPYPDIEDAIPDDMIQCIICEDWYHGRHLELSDLRLKAPPAEKPAVSGAGSAAEAAQNGEASSAKVESTTLSENGAASSDKPPSGDLVVSGKDVSNESTSRKMSFLPKDDSYSEMICHLCVREFHKDFLHAYRGFSVQRVGKANEGPVNVDDDEGTNNASKLDDSTTLAEDSDECKLKAFAESNKNVKVEDEDPSLAPAFFMVDGWRKQLCRCSDCLKVYADKAVSFLLDEEDTVHFYEAKAKSKEAGGSQYEEGMKALSEMDRVKQVEAIHSYNSMKANLMEYLRKFAENGKVVRSEDIQEFFQQMSSPNKRAKLEDGADIPKFCR